jgi:hypothetical protein
VLAEKQTQRPVEQNRALRNKHPSTSNWASTKAQQAHIGAKTASSINSAGKTRCPHSEDWNMSSVSHHVQKSTQNRLKSWCTSWYYETTGKHGRNFKTPVRAMKFWIWPQKCKKQTKIKKMDYIKVESLFLFLGGTGVWTQDLMLARQAFYHLSLSSSP